MHWKIPTTHEVEVEGGTFYVNACGHPTLADSRRTEDPKKVNCRMCKEAFKMPRTRQTLIAKIWLQIEAAKQSDFLVRLCCNACDHELDCYSLGSNHVFTDLRWIETFLEHCAYVHLGGAEYVVYVSQADLSVYELNRAMGKTAMTDHEQAWRDRHALGAEQESVDA